MKKFSLFLALGVLLSGCTSKQEVCRQLGAGMISDSQAYKKLGKPNLKILEDSMKKILQDLEWHSEEVVQIFVEVTWEVIK